MTISLADQLEHFDRKCEQALARRVARLRDPEYKARVIAEARRRLVAKHPEFGDEMFHRTHADLAQAELEEDADGLNYRLARQYQGWPT
jgi:hypothetical protein